MLMYESLDGPGKSSVMRGTIYQLGQWRRLDVDVDGEACCIGGSRGPATYDITMLQLRDWEVSFLRLWPGFGISARRSRTLRAR